MSILAWIEDRRKQKLKSGLDRTPNQASPDGSQGLWTRCDSCGIILYIKHLKENQRVCFGCGYHLQMNSNEQKALSIQIHGVLYMKLFLLATH
jgi:acetyl-CoA carboxylase carboxyl transferase subunit beta